VPDASRCPYLKRIRIRMRVRSTVLQSARSDPPRIEPISAGRVRRGRSSRSQRLAGPDSTRRDLVGTLVLPIHPRFEARRCARMRSARRIAGARSTRDTRRHADRQSWHFHARDVDHFRGRGVSGGGGGGGVIRRERKKTSLLHRSGGENCGGVPASIASAAKWQLCFQTSTYYQRCYHISEKSYANADATLFD